MIVAIPCLRPARAPQLILSIDYYIVESILKLKWQKKHCILDCSDIFKREELFLV